MTGRVCVVAFLFLLGACGSFGAGEHLEKDEPSVVATAEARVDEAPAPVATMDATEPAPAEDATDAGDDAPSEEDAAKPSTDNMKRTCTSILNCLFGPR